VPAHEKPSEDQCWKRFWDIMGPAIANAVREGRVTQDDFVRD
jgi:hypothetical protein